MSARACHAECIRRSASGGVRQAECVRRGRGAGGRVIGAPFAKPLRSEAGALTSARPRPLPRSPQTGQRGKLLSVRSACDHRGGYQQNQDERHKRHSPAGGVGLKPAAEPQAQGGPGRTASVAAANGRLVAHLMYVSYIPGQCTHFLCCPAGVAPPLDDWPNGLAADLRRGPQLRLGACSSTHL